MGPALVTRKGIHPANADFAALVLSLTREESHRLVLCGSSAISTHESIANNILVFKWRLTKEREGHHQLDIGAGRPPSILSSLAKYKTTTFRRSHFFPLVLYIQSVPPVTDYFYYITYFELYHSSCALCREYFIDTLVINDTNHMLSIVQTAVSQFSSNRRVRLNWFVNVRKFVPALVPHY